MFSVVFHVFVITINQKSRFSLIFADFTKFRYQFNPFNTSIFSKKKFFFSKNDVLRIDFSQHLLVRSSSFCHRWKATVLLFHFASLNSTFLHVEHARGLRPIEPPFCCHMATVGRKGLNNNLKSHYIAYCDDFPVKYHVLSHFQPFKDHFAGFG